MVYFTGTSPISFSAKSRTNKKLKGSEPNHMILIENALAGR
jgi:hypothetical protein